MKFHVVNVHGEKITVKAMCELLAVRRPILSANRLVGRGFLVAMGKEGGHKVHKDGREVHLHKSNGVHHVHATTLSKLCPLEDLRYDDGLPAETAREVNLPWTRRLPYRPTEDERMSHSISHLPFRAWCVPYVKGLARDWSHRGECGPQPDIPMDAKNFCFTNTESVDDVWTILAMREKPFQFAGATVLPVRTVSEIAVATIIGYLDCWDRQEVIIKCNQQQNMVRRAELLQGRR